MRKRRLNPQFSAPTARFDKAVKCRSRHAVVATSRALPNRAPRYFEVAKYGAQFAAAAALTPMLLSS